MTPMDSSIVNWQATKVSGVRQNSVSLVSDPNNNYASNDESLVKTNKN